MNPYLLDTVSFSQTDTLNLFYLVNNGQAKNQVGAAFLLSGLILPMPGQVPDPVFTFSNLAGEESDQSRQKTRLTVPDCAVKEISSLTEWSYSISCLTDGGRWLHRENKDRWGEKKKKKKWVPEGVFKQPLPVRMWSQKKAPEVSLAGWPSSLSGQICH